MKTYSSTIKNYFIGWFLASIIWLMIQKFNPETNNVLNLNIVNQTITFFITWFLQAIVFGSLQFLVDRYVKHRVSFIKLQLYSLILQIITAVLLVFVIFYSFKIFTIVEKSRSIIEFLNNLEGLWIAFVYALIVNFTINLVTYIDLTLGKGNLLKMMTGKFYTPRERMKIFMFLDLKSSTTYAEKLGHVKYSKLIQDCFYDLAIVDKYKATIYQYVGDEAVLTWNMNTGIKNNNCIESFFAFKESLLKRKSYYLKTYGVIPEFKAGLNAGKIMLTEVGVFKREIAYHGDTINTTSRLEGECNRLDAEMIISKEVLDQIQEDKNLKITYEDDILLKGKNKKVKMYSVKKIK
ncbi:adenylate/guanylate cyclase domain-containing protein [uncultured Psychroserpens sp.]|uniref:adenylate/guanylate cyclase domain-containing protein n=1 Tax=uncultured Psychroserpens sp. TaxID=255436 RepID=UPI0026335469|nr:adenylate/guanylate cyclase domain-containing protein [uncultured Psychroserpens sp.]